MSESSICVAVITGRASAPASEMICFWTIGTSSIRSSMPRSPRATITQSAARTISSARCDGLRLLDLRDQRQPRVLADDVDVLGAPHERQRDEVDADLLAGRAGGSRSSSGTDGQRGGLARDVEALARGDRAADLDDRVDLAVAAARAGRSRSRTAPSAR